MLSHPHVHRERDGAARPRVAVRAEESGVLHAAEGHSLHRWALCRCFMHRIRHHLFVPAHARCDGPDQSDWQGEGGCAVLQGEREGQGRSCGDHGGERGSVLL